jgi:ribosomal protein S3
VVSAAAVREVVDRHAPPGAGIDSVVLGRSGRRLLVTITADNPTLLIGPQGARIRAVQRTVSGLIDGESVRVNVQQL